MPVWEQIADLWEQILICGNRLRKLQKVKKKSVENENID